MNFPERTPILKIAMALLFLYALFWISLEGRLWQSVLLAALVVFVGASITWQRVLTGLDIAVGLWILLGGLTGLTCGLMVGLLTIIFMVIKTGLHGHGPEFTPLELAWVMKQVPLWSMVGFLAGLGVAVLIYGNRRD